ncbi:ATP-binding cassette subfamily B protein [Friedmanniella endophytica]|uniref:ATP-binding cassette subfamily B protein n=1 Tax=Microlunatus kandeliicorticis TaxID=1759536 RepID=A0A7W3IRZ0_9ACTN|nr:ABC transporter ATP-binding protein [Microlunatus kandeliicorticis]MBA8794169.1 ATP-binding cassette subfamily B protein [Microlunatus kandeliicorticis]
MLTIDTTLTRPDQRETPTSAAPPGAAYPERGWIRRLAGYCWQFRSRVLIAFGAGIVGQTVSVGVPLIQRKIIDDVVLTRQAPLLPWASLLVVAALAVFGFTYLRRFNGGRLSVDVQHRMRTDVFASLAALDGRRQDELDTGQVVGRATSDLTVVQGLLQMLPNLTGNLVLFVVSLAVMFWLSPVLALLALAAVPALWILGSRSRAKLFPASWVAQQHEAELAGAVEAATTGVRVVKGFGQESRELDRVESIARKLFGARLRTVRFNSFFSPALAAIPQLGTVGILALGGYLAIRGHLTLGTFLAFSTYVAQLSGPVRLLSLLLTTGQQARASVIRVFELIDTRPVIEERPDATALRPGPGAVTFEDVAFGYRPDQPLLRGLDLRIEPGETIAVVGGSGSGKSTLGHLLTRSYEVGGGRVLVDGQDVRDVTLASLRASVGVAMEDSFLFSTSVADNIGYGRPGATRDEIEAAARIACADDFIRELPDGYDTVVGEQGLTLSGGQRQRVALARAVLVDPRILLLDDATSAIDARIEARIHEQLHAVAADRTTILMAHRRSTLRLADRIAVLDQGRIVDLGTLDELARRSELFRMLLAGPDDAELDQVAEPEPPGPDGVTASLWDPSRVPAHLDGPASTGTAGRPGRGMGGGGGGGGLMSGLASMPATPELLRAVQSLPATEDDPQVDPAFARAAEERFSLGRMLRRFRGPFLLGLLLVALDALLGLALPVLIRSGIDDGVNRGAISVVIGAAVVALVVVLLDWQTETTGQRITGRTGERFLYTLRVKIFAHLQRLGLDYYEREMGGRILTRMTTDVDALSQFLQTGLVTAVVSLLTFVGILIALLILNLDLMLVVGVVVPVLVVVTLFFRSASARKYRRAREQVSVVNADLQENVAGLRVTQLFGRQRVNADRFAELSDGYRVTRTQAQRLISLYFPFVTLLSDLAGAFVLVLATTQFHERTLTAGGLIAYLLYIDLLFSPIQNLSQVFDGYQQARVGLQRIRDLLSTPTSTPEATEPVVLDEVEGRVEFDRVVFQYERADRPALTGLDLSITPGETVALVGETGAGKSTMVKLIERFYDVTDGRVLIDGHDLRALGLGTFRRRLGLVPQESYLFGGNVRDQIAYGRPGADDAEVEAAARAVGAHAMIAELPGGYLHPVSERGRNLSAGQRQLLALARAELVDPAILLLDEATAALDLRSEALVTRATERVARRRTTLVVAHRLTTAARADRIVYLEDGKVAEQGTQSELIARGAGYAALWEAFVGSEGAAGSELVG